MREKEAHLNLWPRNKMLKEEEDTSVSIQRDRLRASLERNRCLEKENEQLKQEVLRLKSQITSLRAQDFEKRSILWKKVQGSIASNNLMQEKQMVYASNGGGDLTVDSSSPRQEFSVSLATTKERTPRVPKPPPTPSTALHLAPKASGKEAKLPPPPPPLPLKRQGISKNSVRRVPEVIELYRALTRKDGKQDTRTGALGIPVAPNAREMIGEIENRSSYLLAIKSDVESQGEFINLLKNEVENAAYREISGVEAFVKWLDQELSNLVDERAVLKHFPQWPEKKADAMREASCSYRDLKNLESEVASFQDDFNQRTAVSLKCIQALQDKLERSVHNFERVRESAIRRYRDFKIPWEWMLDSGIINQLKMGSMKFAKLHMNRAVIALKSDGSFEDEDLILQSVRFAFRVHQFVGGFDDECKHAFQELRKLASSCYL